MLLLSFVAFALNMRAAAPALPWRWSNPRPHGGNIVDMVYLPQLGVTIQVAELGQIYSSADLNFWVSRQSGTTNDLREPGSIIFVTRPPPS